MNRLLYRCLAVALLCVAARCPGQGSGATPPPGGGTGTERMNWERWDEAERARIERERPCTRACRRARALRSAGRSSEALLEARRMAEIATELKSSSQWQEACELQGRILVDLGRYSEALPLLLEGRRSGGDLAAQADIPLCQLKTGDTRAAREDDVQSRLAKRFAGLPAAALPGMGTSAKLEASLWLDRAVDAEGEFLRSRWAIRAARICPTCVAANWIAADALGALGQRATERKYLLRAAGGTPCGLQARAKEQLGWRTPEECKDRYPQGTVPPPPGEGIEPVPDP